MSELTSNERKSQFSSTISTTSKSSTSDYSLTPREIAHQRRLSNAALFPQSLPTRAIHLPLTTRQKKSRSCSFIDETTESKSVSTFSSRTAPFTELQAPRDNDSEEIGLEIIQSPHSRQQRMSNGGKRSSVARSSTIIADYAETDRVVQPSSTPSIHALPHSQEPSKRSLSSSIFLLEIGVLIVVLILSMVLVLAIREDQANLRTTMQMVYTYIYVVSIGWLVWCALDIIRFRRQWMKLTSEVNDQEVYMDIVERHPHSVSYFPDKHNTGGLFMRIGAGLLCMGSLLLTVIELAKTIEILRIGPNQLVLHSKNYNKAVYITQCITYLFRFLFHCVQFTFLFRYGNIIIDRYHLLAKIGLIHVIIANFCTWFEAIVFETVEELHKYNNYQSSTSIPVTSNTTLVISETVTTALSNVSSELFPLLKAATSSDSTDNSSTGITSTLAFIMKVESTMIIYLYPCLIEYSLICVTVFYIMWRNVDSTKTHSFTHFRDRHIFIINCSRASYGLLFGGVVLLFTVLTLIPDYILQPATAIPITHVTDFVLLLISLTLVWISFYYTTKFFYDQQAHIDGFDKILIVITTIGDFAYSFFGFYATISIEPYTIGLPRGLEIVIGLLSICQTFSQSAFILDTLKRRLTTKDEIRKKPGRQLITALLIVNLAIWMHDSLSAKKVKLNPIQTEFYDPATWSIVQAFSSPLSIFYRFHSSVCLADIWQEVYHDHDHPTSQH